MSALLRSARIGRRNRRRGWKNNDGAVPANEHRRGKSIIHGDPGGEKIHIINAAATAAEWSFLMKVLSVAKPPITSYMTHAPVLSILSTTSEYIPWFLLNYIQIRVLDDGVDFYHFYGDNYNCPFLDNTYIARAFFDKYIGGSIIDFFVNVIDDNYYIIVIVNQNEVSLFPKYNHPSMHPIFIYGYNEQLRSFNVADFFKNGIYDFANATYSEIENGYISCNEKLHWQKGIVLIKRKSFDKKYSISDYSDALERYLYGKESSWCYNHIHDTHVLFGIDSFYERLVKEANLFKRNKQFDNRVFAICCDHIVVLKMLIEYIQDQNRKNYNNLVDKCETQLQLSLQLRNKIIKFGIQNKHSHFDIDDVMDLKYQESDLIKDILNSLK